AGVPQQLLLLDAVLVGPALKIQIVQDPHRLPEVGLVAVAQFPGIPAHHAAHHPAVFPVEVPFIVLAKQCVSLFRRRDHGKSAPFVWNVRSVFSGPAPPPWRRSGRGTPRSARRGWWRWSPARSGPWRRPAFPA